MTSLIPQYPLWKIRLCAAFVFLIIAQCVWAVEPETCYSRQHQKAIVNVRLALTKPGVVMDARVVRSERDCVLACCSEEVKPGAKCNMVVFNGKKQPSEENCFLFHCPAEQDCPLMKAVEGINTYDIYKGLIHLTTLRPTHTTTVLPSTTTSTPAPTTPTTTPTTTLTPTTVPPPTTALPPATAPPTGPPPLIIISTIPAVAVPLATTTTTTTTDATSTSTRRPNKASKKQSKNPKKGRPHPVVATTTRAPASTTTTLHVILVSKEDVYRTADKPQSKTEMLATTPTTTFTSPSTTTTTTTTSTTTTTTTATTTTTTTTTTTASTTTAPTTTTPPLTTSTSTVLPTTAVTTKEQFDPVTATPAVSLLIIPKGVVQPEPPLQDQSQTKAATAGRGAVKSGVVAFMVLGLVVLTMALAIGGRKAMESFDRRHYTRLELNDLHYEV